MEELHYWLFGVGLAVGLVMWICNGFVSGNEKEPLNSRFNKALKKEIKIKLSKTIKSKIIKHPGIKHK